MAAVRDTIREAGAIRRMFGGIATRYDFLNRLLSMGEDERWRRRAAAVADPAGPAGPVLDVCAGTGEMALAWLSRLGDGEAVLAADFCPEMLAQFHAKLAGRGLADRIRILAADTLSLPFPDDRFRATSVAFGIRNVSDLRGGIREMLRVTRPGGSVVILEFTTPTNPIVRPFYLFYFLLVLPFIGNLVSGAGDNAYGYLPRSVLKFPGRERLRRILEEEGLRDVRVENLSMGIVNVLHGRKAG